MLKLYTHGFQENTGDVTQVLYTEFIPDDGQTNIWADKINLKTALLELCTDTEISVC